MSPHPPFRLAVDIGGTFTDIAVSDANGAICATAKTPTTPDDPTTGALEAVHIGLGQLGAAIGDVAGFIHGTTLATNALIERRGAVVASITTEGFRDILEIAYERRYSQYDIEIEKPDMLVPRARCFTVPERMTVHGDVLVPLDEGALDRLIAQLDECRAQAVAICLLHSYANPTHEMRLRELILARRPDLFVSLSSEVSPEAREFDRLSTTVANAYIQPLMSTYIARFAERFAGAGLTCPILMMTSGGGMTTLDTARRLPIRLVESGPSGGAVLAAKVAAQAGLEAVLSFDIGGTTAKLCLIDGHRPQTARNFEIARAARFIKGSGMPVRIPVVEMIEIGAGGGSIASVDGLGRLTVGPRSAGSEPGPAGFGRGGLEATVTDADIALGYIDPDAFAEGRLRIDSDAAIAALNRSLGALNLPAQEAADGLSRIVDENMASAGRMHAVENGKNLGTRCMIAFGGNGPLHATRVARRAGIERILVPPDPGVGSAVGFLDAPVSFEIVRSRPMRLATLDIAAINSLFDTMITEAGAVVEAGAPGSQTIRSRMAFMRYRGQGHEIEIALPDRPLAQTDLPALTDAFETAYGAQFSRPVPGMSIEILNWSLRVSTPPPPLAQPLPDPAPIAAAAQTTRTIHCDLTGNLIEAAVYRRRDLPPGAQFTGPALVVEPQTTTLVSADFSAHVDGGGNLILTRAPTALRDAGERNAAEMQVMWNRLLAVVEEQAQALIRAAFSPIVRECGDISAGIFDRDGRMLAQAVTGTPGHINTMAEAVKSLLARFPVETMVPGDIYITNDPWLASGHLNDFLLLMPAYHEGQVIGFTSCTSHLVDLGGKGMGPEGSDIYDEGLLIPPCKLVEAGTINALLMEIVKANSREPIANEGDIYALVACCEAGVTRLVGMMEEFGLTSLTPLADHIIDTSRAGTLAAIAKVPEGVYRHRLMVDGYEAPIELHAALTVAAYSITLDFDGTSGCSRYGINVPLNYATAYAVFGLRCIIGPEIPNNAGSLEPFRVVAPEGCILNAQSPAPVAMRHTLGQMTPDLVFGCLHQALPDRVPAEGASAMYDLPLRSAPEVARDGGEAFAIEFVHNGGTGARPFRDGLSATAYPSGVLGSQVEIGESTAPVLIRRRELRPDSGGAGRQRGGLGQRIELQSANDETFLLFLSVERITFPAAGRAGGLPGAAGRIRIDDGPDLPGKGEVRIEPGETLIFETPGGGGFGPAHERDPAAVKRDLAEGVIDAGSADIYVSEDKA